MRPPMQKPTRPMRSGAKPRSARACDGGVDVVEEGLVVEALEEGEHLGEVVVGRGPASGAMEQVRCDGVVALPRRSGG